MQNLDNVIHICYELMRRAEVTVTCFKHFYRIRPLWVTKPIAGLVSSCKESWQGG